ncbi:ATP-binding protein [Terrabacter sp. GCM10028922]|uniref:ATP-binding protein n=1 Tax=Terrabacter sp. GCM10028922 TaxID=3273428 RepID=UPI00361DDA42
MAWLTEEAIPGLTFSRGHAYHVGQVGALVRIPLGLTDLFAVVVQVGSAQASDSDSTNSDLAWASPGQAWMHLELLAEGPRSGPIERGVSRYPAIGDPVHLVTAGDMARLFGVEASPGQVRIGHVANAPHLPATIDLNALVSRHAAVVGSTGSGKSSTVSGILHRIADTNRFPSSRVLVIDVHGEYGGGLGASASVFRASAVGNVTSAPEESPSREGGDSQALHIPFWALTFEELVEVAFGSLDDASSAAVQAWIVGERRSYVDRHPELELKPDQVTVDTPIPFSIRRLWLDFHEQVWATHTAQQQAQSESTRAYATESGHEFRGDAQGVVAPVYVPISSSAPKVYLSASPLNLRRQLERLAGLLRDPRYAFLFDPGPWAPDLAGNVSADLGTFLQTWLGNDKAIVVADLSNVPSSVLQAVAGALLRVLYDALIWSRDLPDGGRARPLLVVLEEAHRYVGQDGGSAGTIVERMVKEGRKYGVGLLLVSQRPSEIRPTILSQVGTFVVLRLTNSGDRNLVRASLPDHMSGLFDAVPVLRTGEAVITGEAIKLPTRVVMNIPESERPDSADPVAVSVNAVRGWNAPRGTSDFDRVASAWRRTSTEGVQ